MFGSTTRNHRPAVNPLSLIGSELEQVERIFSSALAPWRTQFGPLLHHLKHLQGKRLRPVLLLLTARACGRVVPAHHVLAAVVEMIHTATLIHDDVLDEAVLRRHVRTFNAVWGNKVGILLGDMLFSQAFHLSSTIGDASACRTIGEAASRVCAGELKQTMAAGNWDLAEEEYYSIVSGKTAALTECCARLGAVYAGADPDLAIRLASFGHDLGMAFQIADDVLDLAGDENRVGKTLGTDLSQRKATLPLIYLWERLGAEEAARQRHLLGDRDADLSRIRDSLRETGALEAARLRAGCYAEQARKAIAVLHDSPSKSALLAITDWVVRRDR